MESRKSIPNVGPRAQGRKALFMLKGSRVHTLPSPREDAATRAHRAACGLPLGAQGSLTVAGGEGEEVGGDGGELGESPVTYDESVLSQPSHPYNRIIQRILHRHREAQSKKEVQEQLTGGHLTPRTDRDYNQEATSSSAPPYTRTNQTMRSSNALQSKAAQSRKDLQEHSGSHLTPRSDRDCSQLPREDPEDDGGLLTSSRNPGGEAKNEPHLQWADILQADHCVNRGDVDPLDLKTCDGLSSPEDQSVSSLDLAKGYLTDRGLITDRRSQENYLQEGGGGRDTTRSEPGHSVPCLLPRLARKRDLQPLDDVLDYFWVYQGMSRQLLDRHSSPSCLWTGREQWFHKKPTKLPPLSLTRGHQSETTSSEYTSSAQSSRPSSEDTLEEKSRENNLMREHSSEHKYRHRRISPVPGFHSHVSEAQIQNPHRVDCGPDADSTGRFPMSAEELGEKGQGRRVTLVVKMPVLTRESSCSDVLEHD